MHWLIVTKTNVPGSKHEKLTNKTGQILGTKHGTQRENETELWKEWTRMPGPNGPTCRKYWQNEMWQVQNAKQTGNTDKWQMKCLQNAWAKLAVNSEKQTTDKTNVKLWDKLQTIALAKLAVNIEMRDKQTDKTEEQNAWENYRQTRLWEKRCANKYLSQLGYINRLNAHKRTRNWLTNRNIINWHINI